ncbi:hypothetical protein GP486_004098 [Trichoglossum hirsutum]|uniref:Uncharacterized protein n=1 Tax=Trichoglossum hirsutum TaxID=265104 RepID=A0A9P8LBM0_9PEZI|nr:hypothetical protein GP486_004098 [Trichoglossum hirsutum]
MAKLTSNNSMKSCSSNHCQKGADARPNILASCYVVDTGPSGIPEVSSGSSSPPPGPPLIADRYNKTTSTEVLNFNSGQPRGGAAYTITEECERLFCESMKIVFLGERGSTDSGALVTGAHISHNGRANTKAGSPGGEANAGPSRGSVDVHRWLEVWDYLGGARFRGFVTSEDEAKSLFIFFDGGVVGKDLKHGYVKNQVCLGRQTALTLFHQQPHCIIGTCRVDTFPVFATRSLH